MDRIKLLRKFLGKIKLELEIIVITRFFFVVVKSLRNIEFS